MDECAHSLRRETMRRLGLPPTMIERLLSNDPQVRSFPNSNSQPRNEITSSGQLTPIFAEKLAE